MIIHAAVVALGLLTPAHCYVLENGSQLCPPPQPGDMRDPAVRAAYFAAYAEALKNQAALLNALTPEQRAKLPPHWQARQRDLNDGK